MIASHHISHRWLIVIPNALSALRLVIAIALPWLPTDYLIYAVFIAGMTDLFDGLAARRFNATSWQGGLLDAIADKCFMLSAITTLILRDYLIAPIAIGLLTRDIAIALMAAYGIATRRWQDFKRVPSRWPGKVTTALLFTTLVVVFSRRLDTWWVVTFAHVTIVSAVIATIDYAILFTRAIKNPGS